MTATEPAASAEIGSELTVSVIITCFNLEPYIGEAIRSVLAQDHRGPIDLVVVDDSSTDGSRDIIRSFSTVRYVATDRNCGVLLATLKGIEASTGELLFFLDGDDIWEPDKLRHCIAAFEADSDCVLVTHDLAFIDSEGRPLPMLSRPAAVLGPLADGARSAMILGGLERQDDYIWLGSAWGIRRTLGRVDEFVAWSRDLPDPDNTYQDWPLAMWVASLPRVRAAYVPKALFRYRLHQANYSGDARSADRAVRNLRRARNTIAAMRQLAAERSLGHETQVVLQSRVRAYEYLSALYRSERRLALSLLPGAWADFRRSATRLKEVVRLAGILLMGPDRFARLSKGLQASE